MVVLVRFIHTPFMPGCIVGRRLVDTDTSSTAPIITSEYGDTWI